MVRLEAVSKRFDTVQAVDGVSLEIERGEFVSLLGPSGCGKSTILRMIAGFEFPDAGRISIDGADVLEVPAHRRPVNMVFQSYALFPHLTVRDNVAFGLRRRRVPKAEVERQVARHLHMVGLDGHDGRYPSQLSGGQQQRVALARALVNQPKVLLLDEPLGALDLQLRKRMQVELKHLQRELSISFIYVTHDQEEALALSDRIAVMEKGRVLQFGSGREIYDRPRSEFVANFLGEANIVTCAVVETGPPMLLTAAGQRFRASAADGVARAPGARVLLALRPEHVVLDVSRPPTDNVLTGTVEDKVFLGSSFLVYLQIAPGTSLTARGVDRRLFDALEPGSPVHAGWQVAHGSVLVG
jgi:spermidine/putrescine transport system ATP-binding protein